MKNVIALLGVLGSVAACETHGVVDSRVESSDGSHMNLRQFRSESRFYYSLSASGPAECGTREVRVVAMGSGHRFKVRFERGPAEPACDS